MICFVPLAAIDLILDLKHYDVRPVLLSSLVALLRPTTEAQQHPNVEGDFLSICLLILILLRIFPDLLHIQFLQCQT